MIKPNALKPFDNVGIVSPCFSFTQEERAVVETALSARSLTPKYGKNIFSLNDSYCGTVAERAQDFNEMISDRNIRMILFEGGEVSNEIIPFLDYEAIKMNPKIICSYSDSTSILNVITQQTGLVTYYGQSWRGAIYSSYNQYWFNQFFQGNTVPLYKTAKGLQSLHGGIATGKLIGGYLLNFSLLMGNPYFTFNCNEKYLLFLEDNICFNGPAPVSRYLSNIAQSTFFESVAGVIIGNYSTENNPEFTHVIQRFATDWDIPFVKCDDFGHGEFQAVFPIGATAELNADIGTITFSESFVL
ncbi:MAG: LD-carboxypeptidase [Clostridia bacterium]|nr:LD-carboxypeptidase [Clostridia bacterium]